jgi:hypothetical protein
VAGADGAIGPAGRAVRDLERLHARLEAQVRRLLLRLDTAKGDDALERDKAALATATATLRQVEQALVDEGATTVRAVVLQRADEAIRRVGGSDIPADARQEILRIVNGQVADVVAVFGVAQDSIRRAVNAGTTTQGSLADLVDEVEGDLNVAFARAAAAVDAAVMAAGRRAVVVAAEGAGVGELVYLYVGPRDRKNRDFCRALVGKAVTRTTMAGLDNRMGLPAADFCGGYGCRHSWAPMLRSEAEAQGITVIG